MVLFLIPLGLFRVISLLAVLPSLVKGDAYEPGQSWRSEASGSAARSRALPAPTRSTPEQLESAADQGGGGDQWPR